MDTNHALPPDNDPASELDHPDYPQWLCRRVGARLKRRRLDLGKTAMGLAAERSDNLSDQTILNNESGRLNPGFVTLGRHCQMLGTTLPEMMAGAMAGSG